MKWWHGLALTWVVVVVWLARAAALASISWSVKWSANSGFKACEAPGPNDAAQKDVTGGANFASNIIDFFMEATWKAW